MPEKIKTNAINQLIYSCFFLILFFLCFLFNINLARWKELGVFSTILILFVLWVIKLVEEEEFSLLRTPLDYPVLAYLVYCFFSFLFASSKSSAWTNFYQLLLYIILFFAAINTIKGQKQIDWIIKFLIVVSFFVGIYGFLQYFGYDFKEWKDMDRIFSTFGNAILFAAFIIFVLPLVANSLIQEKNNLKIIFLLIVFIILLFDLIVTESRGGWLGMLTTAIVFLYLHIRYGYFKETNIKRERIISIGFVICIILGGIVLWKWQALYRVISRPTARLYLWEGAIRMAISRFVFGYGIGSFPLIFPNFRPSGLLDMHPVSKNFVRHAHNEFLEVFAELGIVGLILFIVIIWTIFYLGVILVKNTKEEQPRYLTIALISAIAGDLVFNLTSIDLRFISSATLLWLFSGFIALMYNMYCQNIRVYTGLAQSFREKIKPNIPYFLFRLIIYFLLVFFIIYIMVPTLTKPFKAMFELPKLEQFFDTSQTIDDGIKFFEEEIKKDSTNADFYYRLGTLYAKKEDWTNALKNLDKSVEFDNRNPGPLNNIGNIYFTLGDLKTAIKAYKEAIQADPDYVDSHFNLAFAYFKTGMLNEAVEELDIVLKLDPNNPKALKVREMIIQ